MKSPGVVGLAALLVVCCGIQSAGGSKILAMLNLASPSHYIFNRALIVALAERGHQVTVISLDEEKKPVPNLTSIVLENIYNITRESYNYEDFVQWNMMDMIFMTFDWGTSICEMQMETSGAKTLLNYPSNKQFDLIITELAWGECFFGFIHKFGNPPVVATSGIGILPWQGLTMGNPENPSYIPDFLLDYTDHTTFSERLYNFLVHNIVVHMYEHYHMPKQEAIARKHFKEDLPSFMDIARNFSLVLVNTAFGMDNPRPLLPNVVPIGGMHIKDKPDPLPKDLQKFLDEAKDGFIFFSLGTNLRSDMLTPDKRQALLDAFSELKQRVVWKFESVDLPGVPPNVKISKWLPQSDILAHPNIRMFITHCGMMSTMEATYRGVPIVGIPFFLDQKVNLQKFVTKRVGVPLEYVTLTKENVLKAIRTILDNKSYRENMKKLSAVFRDHPQSALERAVFWTEYVIRHNGAPHLRSAALDLYWHQYLLLDVIAVLAIAVLLVILVVYLILRTIYRMVTKSSKKIKTN